MYSDPFIFDKRRVGSTSSNLRTLNHKLFGNKLMYSDPIFYIATWKLINVL